MLEATHYTAAGARRPAAFALPEATFDGAVNEPVLHQAVKAYLNNQRQGTHQTKTRSFVSGGNQKPWKQKGTGRARQGSTRAPHWRGGGTVFGPQPRDYTTVVPRKVKALARRSALNARAREGRLHVVEKVALAAPRTKALAGWLGALGFDGQNVLVLTHGTNRNAWLSSRNLPQVQVLPFAEVSAYDIMWCEQLLIEEGALTGQEPAVSETLPEQPAARAPKAPRAERPARAVKAAKAPAAGKAKAAKAKAPAKKAAKAVKKQAATRAAKPAPKKKKGE